MSAWKGNGLTTTVRKTYLGGSLRPYKRVRVEIILFHTPNCFHIMNLTITVDIWFKWRKIIAWVHTLKVIYTWAVTMVRKKCMGANMLPTIKRWRPTRTLGWWPWFQLLQGETSLRQPCTYMARGSFLQAPNGSVTCLLLPFYAQPSPKYQNLVSLSISLSPRSGLSHLDSFCTSVVPHIILTWFSSILNTWTRRASAFYSTSLSSKPQLGLELCVYSLRFQSVPPGHVCL